VQRRRTGATQLRDAGAGAPAQWPRQRRLGRRRRHNDLRRSSRLHSFRSVLGFFTVLRHQSRQLHAPGSSPQHVRSRRQGFLSQKRNDPSKSHCARRIKSLRTRNGRASHSSSVSRPGKLRVPTGRQSEACLRVDFQFALTLTWAQRCALLPTLQVTSRRTRCRQARTAKAKMCDEGHFAPSTPAVLSTHDVDGGGRYDCSCEKGWRGVRSMV
jgi:hypothetical protein